YRETGRPILNFSTTVTNTEDVRRPGTIRHNLLSRDSTGFYPDGSFRGRYRGKEWELEPYFKVQVPSNRVGNSPFSRARLHSSGPTAKIFCSSPLDRKLLSRERA